MPHIYHLDYETFSNIVLDDMGAHRYAADPSAAVLMLAIAKDDEDPRILLPEETLDMLGMSQDPVALQWAREIFADPTALVYAHNAGFEQAVARWIPSFWTEDLGCQPPRLEQYRCTAAMARRAGLPHKLEVLAQVLHLPQQKDAAGKKLINLFSKRQSVGKRKGKRVYPWEEPERFREMISYCLQDVRTERAVHKCLATFEFKGALLDAWLFDLRCNNRGVPVNLQALRVARHIMEQTQVQLGNEFRTITGLGYTQRDKVLAWFRARGYPRSDMQALSVEAALEDPSWTSDPLVLQALKLKSELGFAAVAKINSMLDCQIDGRVYGTLYFYGAGTGRWAGSLIQPQNFKRPTFGETEAAYRAICDGTVTCAEDMQLLFGAPLDVLSSCIRHFIQLSGGKLLDADYAQIEARIVCWLAGQQDALDDFASGADRYKRMATVIFAKRLELISKLERWVGKQTVLGCGFGMGPVKFLTQCKQKAAQEGLEVQLTPEIAERAVKVFRDENPKLPKLWTAADKAARLAILYPGKVFHAGQYLQFFVIRTGGVPFLCMKLPSGRSLFYPWPALEEIEGRTCITFYGKLPHRNNAWGRVKTYGGKLVENATQATAFDLMANGSCNAEADDYEIFMLVHDEAIAPEDERPVQQFCDDLARLPDWAAGIPLKAEGEVIPFYKKG